LITVFSDGQKGKGTVLSKAEAGYHALDYLYPCMMCRCFEAYLGVCSVVEGVVRPDATCDHWRSGEDEAGERRGFN
jgi:hypothetical protein